MGAIESQIIMFCWHFTSAIFMLSNKNRYYQEWCPSLYPSSNSVHLLYNKLKSTDGIKSSLLYAGRLDCKPGIIHTDRMSNETGIRNETGQNQWLSWRFGQKYIIISACRIKFNTPNYHQTACQASNDNMYIAYQVTTCWLCMLHSIKS